MNSATVTALVTAVAGLVAALGGIGLHLNLRAQHNQLKAEIHRALGGRATPS
jgi:hypothetical protein